MTESRQKDQENSDAPLKDQAQPAARETMTQEERDLMMQAWSALVRGAGEEALAKFRHVQQLWPENIEAHYGEAATLKAMGRGAEAMDAYRKTVEQLGQLAENADRVRTLMIRHLAESGLSDLQAHGGQPAHYEVPR